MEPARFSSCKRTPQAPPPRRASSRISSRSRARGSCPEPTRARATPTKYSRSEGFDSARASHSLSMVSKSPFSNWCCVVREMLIGEDEDSRFCKLRPMTDAEVPGPFLSEAGGGEGDPLPEGALARQL